VRVVLVLLTLLVAIPAFAQPPRDIRRPIAGGTARIAGTVRSADAQARPLRRARVMLNGDALAIGRTVIADDGGAFVFDGLARSCAGFVSVLDRLPNRLLVR
jgi:hypothetical protein